MCYITFTGGGYEYGLIHDQFPSMDSAIRNLDPFHKH